MTDKPGTAGTGDRPILDGGEYMSQLRQARLELLYDAYGGDHQDIHSDVERYAAVSGTAETETAIVHTFDDQTEGFAHLGDMILEGLQPEAVFDLDTGERIEIHVSTPIVTKSEDQGVMNNPLDVTTMGPVHDVRVMCPPNKQEPTGIYVSTMETEHYTWSAVGRTEQEARDALTRGWEVHIRRAMDLPEDAELCGESGGDQMAGSTALDWYGVNTTEQAFGLCYLDGSAIAGSNPTERGATT